MFRCAGLKNFVPDDTFAKTYDLFNPLLVGLGAYDTGMKRKRDLKIGDLVTWTPDGDVGVVTKVDHDHDGRPGCGDRPEPYWVMWFDDPDANGWHGWDDGFLYLLSGG